MEKLNIEPIEGVRVWNKIPEYLDAEAVENVIRGTELKIVDFGTLGNYKRFMKKYTDFNKGSNSSMKESEWHGTKTWKEFIELLDNGDDKVIKKIKIATDKKVAELEKKYHHEIINYRFDVTGEFFDVGLVLTGVPECWLEPEVVEVEKVKVDLVVNGAFHAGFDKDDIIKSSARILAITKILEDNDIQVRIKLVSMNVAYDTEREKSLLGIVTVKDFDEPMNYKKCSALLSPTYHRRGLFKAMEVSVDGRMNGGYGTPRKFDGVIQLNDYTQIDELERKLFTGGKK